MKTNKKKYMNSALDIAEVKDYIDLLKDSGKPFSVTMSNYTTTIESTHINIRFMKEEKSLTFFARSKELIKQVDIFLQNHEIDEVKNPNYYDVKECENFILPEVTNIDLSSAYLNVLFNNSIIDRTLFDKLSILPKQDRLGVVGMLASKKQKFTFDDKGKILQVEQIENKQHRNIFFYCVLCVANIMSEIKKIVGENYIFTWVDGIYFKGSEKIEQIENFLNSINYPYKVEQLQNFEFFNNRGIAEIDYLKNNKKKTFNIPIEKNDTFAEEIYKYINK